MSQREFLREFDADAASAFMDSGIADHAIYKPNVPGSAPIVGVSVLVDRAVAYQDFSAGIQSVVTVLTAFRSEIGESNPPNGSTFALVDDNGTPTGEVFSVDRVNEQSDESRVVMTVRKR